MTRRVIELECEKVAFYSPQDEASFFAWAESVPAVVSVTGRGRSIVITVKGTRIAGSSLRELLSLFRRYHISMRRLAQFRTDRNEAWFASPEAYWFKPVFGDATDIQRKF